MRPAGSILHIIDSLDYAGAQKLLLLLGKNWPEANGRMGVVVLQDRLAMLPQFQEHGVPVISLNRKRPSIVQPWKFIAYCLGTMKDLMAVCRRYQVKVCVLHLSDAEFLGTIAARLAKVSKVFVVSHLPRLLPMRSAWDPRNLMRRLLLQRIYAQVTGFVAVSDETADSLQKFVKKKNLQIATVINAVETQHRPKPEESERVRRELLLAPGEKVLLSVGRLTEQKGQIFALMAASLLVSRGHPIRLLIVGEGELKGPLLEQVSQRGLQSRVCFLGTRPDVDVLMHLADIFVFPSLYEGTSLALLEAMAAGKAIVTTDIPPHRKILRHGHSAMLVPPGDAQALCEAIETLLHHPELMVSLGAEAQRLAFDRYDIRPFVEQLKTLWS
ncbi:glycosyltransferase [Desulfosoma sp.]